jgi:hypothetical protein
MTSVSRRDSPDSRLSECRESRDGLANDLPGLLANAGTIYMNDR